MNARLNASRSRVWIYVVIIAGVISAGLFFLGRHDQQAKRGWSSAGKVDRGAAV